MKDSTRNRHEFSRCLIAFAVFFSPILLFANQAIPLTAEDIDAQLSKQTKDIHTIEKTGYGAELKCPTQAVKAEIRKDEFRIISTRKEDRNAAFSLRVNNFNKGSQKISPEVDSSQVSVDKQLVTVSGDDLIQEFSTKYDGIRQDFIVKTKPAGNKKLSLSLDLSGAVARKHQKREGALITLRNGRRFVYGKLLVADATGKKIPARFDIPSENQIDIIVDDADAQYPIRLDPTI